MQTIYLDKAMIPEHLRRGYDGTKFRASVVASVAIPMTAGLWDGGSCDKYALVRLADGFALPCPWENTAPGSRQRYGTVLTLQPGMAVVRHIWFQGADLGLHFYVHPADAALMLAPSTPDLALLEQLVLYATRSFKSSYGGRDRYEMARDDYTARKIIGNLPYPTRTAWEGARDSLIARGLLNKAGAITVAGRNAAANLKAED